MLRSLLPGLYSAKSGPVKSIVLCFRSWPLIDSKIADTIEKAVKLCSYLLNDKDRELCFLSTCHGVSGYVDDSVYARQILEKLPDVYRARCKVDELRYNTQDLIKAYSKYDAFIGMRLHGALLSMLGGTAAMGIGYEDKTEGIFSSMGFKEFQVSFDMPVEEWISCTKNFLTKIEQIRLSLPAILDRMDTSARESISITKNILQTK